jgi:hypothetical protein
MATAQLFMCQLLLPPAPVASCHNKGN